MMKQCMLCAEEIPLAAQECPFCGARYRIRSDGYCLKCHEFRQADETGKCTVCGETVADWQVESTFIEVAALPLPGVTIAQAAATAQAAVHTADVRPSKSGSKRASLVIVGVIVALCGISLLGWSILRRTAAVMTPIMTQVATRPALATKASATRAATATKTPTRAPTRTPRPTATNTPPGWVVDFAEPHLANIARRPPTFKDDISNEKNSRYFWGGNPEITFNNGIMQLSVTNGGIDVGGGRVNDDTPNFILEYEMTPRSIAGSGGVHVLFRYSNQGYYGLGFHGDGSWEIAYSDNKTGDHIVTRGKSDQVGIDQKTKVILIVRRDEMALYLDDQPAGYGRYTAPMTNVFTFNLNAPVGTTAVDIDNVKFWDLDSLKPKSE